MSTIRFLPTKEKSVKDPAAHTEYYCFFNRNRQLKRTNHAAPNGRCYSSNVGDVRQSNDVGYFALDEKRWQTPHHSAFFNTWIDWDTLFFQFFQKYHYQPGVTYILDGDESVVTKSGYKTHGFDRYNAGLINKPVESIAIFALSLIDVTTHQSHPVQVEQVVCTAARRKKAAANAGI